MICRIHNTLNCSLIPPLLSPNSILPSALSFQTNISVIYYYEFHQGTTSENHIFGIGILVMKIGRIKQLTDREENVEAYFHRLFDYFFSVGWTTVTSESSQLMLSHSYRECKLKNYTALKMEWLFLRDGRNKHRPTVASLSSHTYAGR